MFDQVTKKYHTYALDNLYNSVKFAHAAWTSKNKIKIFGVTWQGG